MSYSTNSTQYLDHFDNDYQIVYDDKSYILLTRLQKYKLIKLNITTDNKLITFINTIKNDYNNSDNDNRCHIVYYDNIYILFTNDYYYRLEKVNDDIEKIIPLEIIRQILKDNSKYIISQIEQQLSEKKDDTEISKNVKDLLDENNKEIAQLLLTQVKQYNNTGSKNLLKEHYNDILDKTTKLLKNKGKISLPKLDLENRLDDIDAQIKNKASIEGIAILETQLNTLSTSLTESLDKITILQNQHTELINKFNNEIPIIIQTQITNLENKLDTENKILIEKIDEINKIIENKSLEFEAMNNNTKNNLQQQILELSATLKNSITVELTTTVEKDLDDLYNKLKSETDTSLEQVKTEINSNIDEKIKTNLDKFLNNTLQDFKIQINSELRRTNIKITDIDSSLKDNNITILDLLTKNTELDKTLTEYENYINEQLEMLKTNIENLNKNKEESNNSNKLDSSLQKIISDIEDINKKSQITEEEINRINRLLLDSQTTFKNDLIALKAEFTKELDGLSGSMEIKINKVSSEYKKEIAELKSFLLQQITSLNISEKNDTDILPIQQSLTQTINNLEKLQKSFEKEIKEIKEINNKPQITKDEIDKILLDTQLTFTRKLNELDNKFTNELDGLSGSIEIKINKVSSEYKEEISELQNKLEKQINSLNISEQIDNSILPIQQQLKKLEESFEQQISEIKKINNKSQIPDNEVNSLLLNIQSTFTTKLKELDDKFTKELEMLSGRMQLEIMNISNKYDKKITELKKNLENNNNRLTELNSIYQDTQLNTQDIQKILAENTKLEEKIGKILSEKLALYDNQFLLIEQELKEKPSLTTFNENVSLQLGLHNSINDKIIAIQNEIENLKKLPNNTQKITELEARINQLTSESQKKVSEISLEEFTNLQNEHTKLTEFVNLKNKELQQQLQIYNEYINKIENENSGFPKIKSDIVKLQTVNNSQSEREKKLFEIIKENSIVLKKDKEKLKYLDMYITDLDTRLQEYVDNKSDLEDKEKLEELQTSFITIVDNIDTLSTKLSTIEKNSEIIKGSIQTQIASSINTLQQELNRKLETTFNRLLEEKFNESKQYIDQNFETKISTNDKLTNLKIALQQLYASTDSLNKLNSDIDEKIKLLSDNTDEQFKDIDTKFGNISQNTSNRFLDISTKFNSIDNKLKDSDVELDSLKKRISDINIKPLCDNCKKNPRLLKIPCINEHKLCELCLRGIIDDASNSPSDKKKCPACINEDLRKGLGIKELDKKTRDEIRSILSKDVRYAFGGKLTLPKLKKLSKLI